MASMLKLIGDVRRKCANYPPQDGPGEGILAEFLLDVLDYCVTELNLSVPPWILPRFLLTVAAGQDETPISQVGDFGRPYMVLTVPSTSYPLDTRVIDIVEPTALARYFGAGDQGGSATLTTNTSWASACAFSYHDGLNYFQVAPVPLGTSDYRILYEPSTVRPANVQDQAFRLPQFDSYITDMAAMHVLPYVKLDPAMAANISKSLAVSVARGDEQFRRFRRSDRNNDRVMSIPFGATRWRRRRMG